jgi:hypothetical protein
MPQWCPLVNNGPIFDLMLSEFSVKHVMTEDVYEQFPENVPDLFQSD